MSIILRSLCSFCSLSTCIKRINLYNKNFHCDLQLPIPWDRLQLLNYSQQYGLNNSITLSCISSSDRVIHQAVMLLLKFVLSSAICLASFHVFHSNSSLSCATVFRQFVFSCPILLHLFFLSSYNTAQSLAALKILII